VRAIAVAKALTRVTRLPARGAAAVDGGAKEPEGGSPPPAEARLFAVKTTIGHEQEVAEGIRERAAREKVEVRSVVSPKPILGFVFVECADLDRLTNLVGSVKHSRGVVRSRAAPDDPDASAIPLAQIEHFLSQEADQPLPDWLKDELAEGPFRRERGGGGIRRAARVEAREGRPRGAPSREG
jgi:transcriptional antiterminator NusG